MTIDFPGLARELLSRTPDLLYEWLPGGRMSGPEYICAGLQGGQGRSLSVNTSNGVWKDFAANVGGGDLINLYAAIKGMSNGEAAKALSNGHANGHSPSRNGNHRTPPDPDRITTPSEALCNCEHPSHGTPSHVYRYRNAEGQTIGYVARYDIIVDGKPDKTYCPWTYSGRWEPRGWAKPRPLYGLYDLATRPTSAVLIVEGEKAADALRTVCNQYVVVTWPNGAQSVRTADWTPVYGRRVLIWPDADAAGRKAMEDLAAILGPNCPAVKMLAVERNDHWDAADAIADGWTWEHIKSWAAPRAIVWEPPRSVIAVAEPTPTPEQRGTPAAKWLKWGLSKTAKGLPITNMSNVVAILANDPEWAGKVWYDEFKDRILTADGEWRSSDDLRLCHYIQTVLDIPSMSVQSVQQGLERYASLRTRNCVREYLDSLTWDGVTRLERTFPDIFSSPDTAWEAAVGRCFWISLVARAYRPGCKVDTCVVVNGGEGMGKSSAFSLIASEELFTTQLQRPDDAKAFAECLQSKLIAEIAELDSFSKSEITTVKATITTQSFRYRGAYKSRAEDHPMQGIYVGTTNKQFWNHSDTGARRFLPIECQGKINLDLLRELRDQFFAEAVVRFRQGEDWWELPQDLALQQQESRRAADVWEPKLREWLKGKSSVTLSEVLSDCYQLPLREQVRPVEYRVRSILSALRWNGGKDTDGAETWTPPD